MRLDEVEQPITNTQLNALEKALDNLFSSLNIDVEFTRHFIDRANDDRNGQQITMPELVNLFKKEYKRWGKPIAQMGPDAEAVMKDLESDINIPFVLKWDRDNEELDLVAKTVMRKKNFKTSNKEFPVESTVDVSEDFGSVPPLAELIIMAVLAKTTVDVLKGMFKVAITTGKGIKKLRSLQQKTKRLGQNIADYALPEDFSHPDKAILNVPERYMKAALDALHRLVTYKGNRQSVSGYAFDISRTMHGINARELADVYNKIHESNEDDFYLIVEYNKGQPVKQSDPLRVLDNLAARADNMPFPIKFKDNEEIKVTPELAKRFTMAYHDIARPEQKEIIKQYLRTKEGFKKIVNKMQLNKSNFGKNANANLASLDRNIKN